MNTSQHSKRVGTHTHNIAVANLPRSVLGHVSPYPTVVPVIIVKYIAECQSKSSTICMNNIVPNPSANSLGPTTPPGILSCHEDERSITGPQNIPNPQNDNVMINNLPSGVNLSDGHISPYPTLSLF